MKFKMDAKVKDRSVVVIRCGGRGQTGEESRAPDLYPSWNSEFTQSQIDRAVDSK